MSCLSPILIKSNAKGANGQMMSVPCGKCIGCLRDKQDAWIYRLQREQSFSKYSYFVTLTYDERNIPLLLTDKKDYGKIVTYEQYIRSRDIRDCVLSVNPRDFTLYIKRVRKVYKGRFKYYACFEYGDQFDRPHMHFACFAQSDPVGLQQAINDCWDKGFVTIEALTDSRIAYVTKYINKSSLEAPPSEHSLKCQMRASKGLGVDGFFSDEAYHHNFTQDDLKEVYLNNGSRIGLPRYFRRKYYPHRDFTIELQQQFEYERQKKEQIARERYYQDILICSGSVDFKKAASSYLQNQDAERQRRNLDITRKRRKGL